MITYLYYFDDNVVKFFEDLFFLLHEISTLHAFFFLHFLFPIRNSKKN